MLWWGGFFGLVSFLGVIFVVVFALFLFFMVCVIILFVNVLRPEINVSCNLSLNVTGHTRVL